MIDHEAIRLQHPTRWGTRDWWPMPSELGMIEKILRATGRHDEQLDKWHCTCRHMLRHLAQTDLRTLLRIMYLGLLSETELTFAAEFLAGTDDNSATDMLFALLRDDRAIVREGAILGLHGSASSRKTRWMGQMAETDPSPGVRQAARDFLEAHND